MTRGILIAGNESSLFFALSAEAAKRVESFAAALIPNRFSLPSTEGAAPAAVSEGSQSLQWNPASPISARSLVLAAENRLGRVDDALLVCSPPAMYRNAETLLPAEVETLVNDHIKGWFFLVRELALVFRARQRGTLAMVVPDIAGGGGRDPAADLLGPPAAASFRAFAQGLLSSSFNEPFQVLGFSSSEAGQEAGFAAWLFKIIDEAGKKNSGKWHKYTRFSFFK
jgi:NAD(P)-dependent dehydrogenase (short-subunit alcohol dehydrogenase family)